MTTDYGFSHRIADTTLHGRIHPPAAGQRAPIVIVCHGFKGFMEWGFFPYLADLLAARGFYVVRFNFSGSGMLPGDELVTDTAAFAAATFSKDLAELRAVINALDVIAPESADPDTVGLVGHSRGGGIALLAAAAELSKVHALVTWAGVGSFFRLPDEALDAWRREGALPIVNARTGQQLGIDVEVLSDLEKNRDALDLEAAAARRRAPWLIVHGTADQTVPFNEARELLAAAAEPAELLPVEGSDHTFGARHPFVGPTPQLIEAMNATQRWLRRHLSTNQTPDSIGAR